MEVMSATGDAVFRLHRGADGWLWFRHFVWQEAASGFVAIDEGGPLSKVQEVAVLSALLGENEDPSTSYLEG